MKTYEIFWDDLNEEAKARLAPLWHENIEICPLAIIDREEEDEEKGGGEHEPR